MNNKKAFTLTELIIALGIIGAIAALTIPSIMKNINKKILSTQLKNTVASIQQLVGNQMVQYRTKILSDTDFSTPATLLSSSNFEIVGACTDGAEDNTIPCWASAYKVIKVSDSGNTYPSALTSNATVANTETAVKLKNGVSIAYKTDSTTIGDTTAIGKFYVDVNGTEEPNVIGRDFFAFYLTKKGQIVGSQTSSVCHNTSTTTIEAGLECFSAITKNNWKMPDNDADY